MGVKTITRQYAYNVITLTVFRHHCRVLRSSDLHLPGQVARSEHIYDEFTGHLRRLRTAGSDRLRRQMDLARAAFDTVFHLQAGARQQRIAKRLVRFQRSCQHREYRSYYKV